MRKIVLLSLLLSCAMFMACHKKPEVILSDYLPEEKAVLDQYLTLPDEMDVYDPKFLYNMVVAGVERPRIDRRKAVLGRVLFYDQHLSKDGTISCASCHKQELGFGDDKAVSPGVFGRLGERNSLPLSSVVSFGAQYGTDMNGQMASRFFWDNRSETAEAQIISSMSNPKEMNMDMGEIVAAVQSQPFYSVLFEKAYGDAGITPKRITEAIANFVNSMGSFQSKFDQAFSKNPFEYIQTDFSDFTASENRGKTIYLQNCACCHSSRMTIGALSNTSNGLDAEANGDQGVGGISGATGDMGTFKVPTLRNIALTAPYMHDGRFQTLEQVVEHYNSGVQNHPNLSPMLKNNDGTPKRMNLSETAKQDLIAFLYTLTDETIRTDKRFSNPFK
ncbi:MAG: c-type cytochrome [Saprospiraceae bacterium]|nr:c-type cytochrome [Saprospiraceae bacterium]